MLAHKASNSHTASGRPDIIIIMTDQQRWDAVGYINSSVVTPNLDALAKQSVICTNAFVQSPQCQPSRASIWTGRYPTAHRVWWNETQLPASEKTMGNYLSNAGYDTAYFGKLHVLNTSKQSDVAKRCGFRSSFLFENWSTLVNRPKHKTRIYTEFHKPMEKKNWAGQFTDRTLHHEDVITEKALEWLKIGKHPKFLVVSYHGPHPPYAAPLEFSSLYQPDQMSVPTKRIPNYHGHTLTAEEWRELKVQYYGAVSWIDDNIGRLLKEVDRNAIVVFLSDHGDILGDHGLFSKGLFAYDGNVQIPLLMRLPKIDSKRYNHLVEAIDILPTVLRAANCDVSREVQGQSLLSAFHNDMPIHAEVLSMIGHQPRLRMIRSKEAKYWIYDKDETLFDLKIDPTEEKNVAGSNPQLLNAMRFRLMKALIQAEDPTPYPVDQ